VRLARAVAAAVVVEVVAVAVPQATRQSPAKPSRPRPMKLPKSVTPPRAHAVGGGDAGGGERSQPPLQTTRRTRLFECASPAVKTPIVKFLGLTDRPGWRPSGSGDAKDGRQVGVARPS
jgi:hypothetical protein